MAVVAEPEPRRRTCGAAFEDAGETVIAMGRLVRRAEDGPRVVLKGVERSWPS